MKVYPHIFLSRNEIEVPGSLPLEDGLKYVMAGADRFVIISAYYGVSYLRDLLLSVKRKDKKVCRLAMVFGIENDARLGAATRELRILAEDLRLAGYPAPEVKLLVGGMVPFHVKLYFAKRATQPLWFVGSANASSAIAGARHEMMIRLSGKHAELAAYRDAVIAMASSVSETVVVPDVVYDLRSFFLHGSLCFKPLNRVAFNFEACDIKQEHRKALNDGLTEFSEVPHAAPQTEGFGFNLLDAVEQVSGMERSGLLGSEDEVDKRVRKLRVRNRCIETNYGYWMPEPYAQGIKAAVAEVAGDGLEAFKLLGEKLGAASTECLERELAAHVEGLRRFFHSRKIKILTKRDYVEKFRRFVASRRSLLTNGDAIARMVTRLKVEPMPDIWSDESAAERFEASFFDDLLFRIASGSKHWVPGVIRNELIDYPGTDTVAGLRTALVDRLTRGFPESSWGMGEDIEEGEDDLP